MMGLYSGVAASYESKCTGSDYGACGTCRNSNDQAAWRNLAGGFSPACYCGCGFSFSIPELSCGDKLLVYDRCTGYSVCASIADHGPGSTPSECHATVQDCSVGTYLPRLLDLTKGAFATIADLTLGVIPVSVSTSPTGTC